MKFTPDGGVFTAYLVAAVGKSKDTIGFAGKNVHFGPGGVSEGRLQLIGNPSVDMGKNKLIVNGNGKSYVDFDCKGFVDAELDGTVEFSNELIKPSPDNTPDGKVKATFSAHVDKDFDDVMVSANITTPFEVTKLKDFVFTVDSVTLDLSDKNNMSSMVFPADYSTDEQTDWEGFYAKEFSIQIPKGFKKNGNTVASIKVNNLLIDRYGVSAKFEGTGLIPFGSGDMSGWAFSLDTLFVPVVRNIPTGAKLSGLIEVPLLDGTQFGYRALFDLDGNMLLNVKLNEDKEIPFKAFQDTKLTLFQNSYVEIKSNGDSFTPKAVLNGQMTIESKTPNISIGDLVFSDLVISANPFKFEIGNFALRNKKQYSFSGFPLSVHDVGFLKEGERVGIQFGIKLNLEGDGDNGFSADATLKVASKIDVDGFNKVTVSDATINLTKVAVDVDMGAVSIKGELQSYDHDPVYGDGIKGMVDAKLAGIGVSATAQFGSVTNFRYWYVDALVTLPNPIVFMPGLGIYGFGGGAYRHMVRKGSNVNLPPGTVSKTDNSTKAGTTLSGIVYTPDKNIGLGLKATIEIGTLGERKTFNGNGTLEVAFNSKGGINSIGLNANAYFMTEVEKRDKANTYAKLDAAIRLDTLSFFADLQVYVNVQGIVKGTGANNLAGEAQIMFSQKEWYIWIGDPDPDRRVGLEFIGFVTAKAYFVVGTKNLVFPDLNELLAGAKYFPGTGEVKRSINPDELHQGGGFGFGASIDIQKSLSFTIFYASVHAIAGFDVMIKNYGGSTYCQGETTPIGMNGWYAMGQAYAYLDASIGIQVKIFFKKKKFSILDVAAWATLEAKIPHPSWFQGRIGGHYSILGGLVSGNCNFKVTLGDQCVFESSSELDEIPIIAGIKPAAEATDVDVFSDIIVDFNQPVSKEFTLDDEDSKVKISVVDTIVTYGNNQRVTGTWKFSGSNNEVYVFTPDIILPSETQITVTVKVKPEEYKYGKWIPFIDDNNAPVYESASVQFTTGIYDKLTELNIDYSYPLSHQVNYYTGEPLPGGKGYIQLKRPQPSLFDLAENTTQKIRFSIADQMISETDCEHSGDDKSITFTMPSSLEKGTVYKLEIVDRSANNKEDIKYSTYFRTSRYATVAEKISSFASKENIEKNDELGFNILGYTGVGNEFFDKYEIMGTESVAPLIECEFSTDNDKWFRDLMQLLPIDVTEAKTHANISIVGGAPAEMTDEQARLGTVSFSNSSVQISTDVDSYCYSVWKSTVVPGEYPRISKGGHVVNIKYTIPGKDKKNTEVSSTTINL